MPGLQLETPRSYLTELAQTHEPIMALAEMIGAYHSINHPAEKLACRGLVRSIARTGLLETPLEVTNRGNVLTNPSQVGLMRVGEKVYRFGYFRDEPRDDHLGKTRSRPYLIVPDGEGGFRLVECAPEDAEEKPGEDPRLMPGITLEGRLGKRHHGVSISTLIAIPRPDLPFQAEVKQVFWWGEDYSKLEPVAEIYGHKNAGVAPDHQGSSRLHAIGRPHPHVTYTQLPGDLTTLNNETLFRDAVTFTEKLRIPGIHYGGNGIHVVRGGDDPLIGLDFHTGYGVMRPDGAKELHYWQSDWILQPREKIIARCIGTFATRGHFEHADPKPPNGVVYDGVIYGARGSQGRQPGGLTLFGIGDSRVGYAVMS